MKILSTIFAVLLLTSTVFAQYDKEVINSLKAVGLDSVTYYKVVELSVSAPGRIRPMDNNWNEFVAEVQKLNYNSFVYIHGKADRPGSMERNYTVAIWRSEWIRNNIVSMKMDGVTPVILSPMLNQDTRGVQIIIVTAVAKKKCIPIVKDVFTQAQIDALWRAHDRMKDDNAAFVSSVIKRLELSKKINNSLSERVRFGLGFAGSYGSVHRPTYGPSGALALPMFGVSYIQLRAYGLGSYEGQSGITLTLDANVRLWRSREMHELYVTGGASYTSYKRRFAPKFMEGGLYGGATYNIPLGEYNVVNFTLAVSLIGDLDIQHQASAWTNQSVRPFGAVAFWF